MIRRHEWQPYLAKALLASRFLQTGKDRRSFATGAAIGAANALTIRISDAFAAGDQANR